MVLIYGILFGIVSGIVSKYAIQDPNLHFLPVAIICAQVHTIIFAAAGLALFSGLSMVNSKIFSWIKRLFIITTTLFSYSIYLSIYFDLPGLANLTPFGGMVIMLVWTVFLKTVVFTRKKL